MPKFIVAPLLGGFLALSVAPAWAQDPAKTQAQQQTRQQNRELIYGSQLMTHQERNEYRARMRALKSQQEREQLRAEHHRKMQERAKEKGLTLPDEPPARGTGPGGGPRRP